MTQGQSRATLEKIRLFSFCVGWSVLHSDGRYYGFDLHAGSGTNRTYRKHRNHREQAIQVKGTPALLLDVLKQHHREGHLYFCEQDKRRMAALRSRLPLNGDLFGDPIQLHWLRMFNADFVPTIGRCIADNGDDPAKTFGIVILDPNGLKPLTVGHEKPVPMQDYLAPTLRAVPQLDVLIHICSLRQQQGYWRRPRDRWDYAPRPGVVRTLRDIVNLPRRHWLVGAMNLNRGHHILFGSNRPIRPIRYPGLPPMYDTRSHEGHAMIAATDLPAGLEWIQA